PSGSMSASARSAPSLASRKATARPIPRAPPVTMITRPSNPMSCGLSSVVPRSGRRCQVARVLVRPPERLLDGILEGGQVDLLAQGGGEVDTAHVGQSEQQPQAVGQLVGQLAAVGRVVEQAADLLVGAVAEMLEDLAHLAGQGDPQVLGVVDLLPVPLPREREHPALQLSNRRLLVGHRGSSSSRPIETPPSARLPPPQPGRRATAPIAHGAKVSLYSAIVRTLPQSSDMRMRRA